jgi:hypothetical protein
MRRLSPIAIPAALILAVSLTAIHRARADGTPAPAPASKDAPTPQASPGESAPPQGETIDPRGELPPGAPGVGSHPAPPPEVQREMQRERAADEKSRALRQDAQAHAGDPHYQTLYVDGLLDLGRDDEALLVAPALIEKFPRSAELSAAFGRALLRDGRFDLAAVQFQRAITLDAVQPRVFVLAGKTAVIQGDLATAEADLRKAISLDPGMMEARSALSLVLERERRYQEAIDALNAPGAREGAELVGRRKLLQQFVKNPPLVLPQGFTRVSIPFAQQRGFPPLVKATVGGGVEKYFVIDTASDEAILTSGAAKAFGLPERAKETAKDEEGNEHLMPVYAVLDQMTIGDLIVRRIPVRVSPGLRYPDDRIAGTIGRNFLRRFRVTIDYPAKTLVLAKSAGPALEGTPFGLATVMLVDGRIGDETVGPFVVDTSSYTPGAMDAKFVAEQTGKTIFSTDVTKINQGPYLFKFTMPRLRVGGANFVDFPATAVDLRTMSQQVGVSVRGVIGLSLLRSCRVEIDFEEQRIALEKPAAPAAPAGPAS